MTAPDQSIREQALDPRASFIVQAPAGSGKTALLIQRYLSLLALADEPEEVLAITFTRKAVAEMRKRVLDALQQCAGPRPRSEHARRTWGLAGAVLRRSRERDWNIARQPARLSIMTIDALNAGLVKNMPWLSGLGADPVLQENPQSLYEEAAWHSVDGRDLDPAKAQALRVLLLHFDNDDRRVVKLLCELMAKREQWLGFVMPLTRERDLRARLTAMFESVVEAELRRVAAAVDEANGRELARIAATAAARLHDQATPKPHSVCRGLRGLPGCALGDIAQWQGLAGLFVTTAGTWRTAKGLNKTLGFPPGCAEKEDYDALRQKLTDAPELLSALNDIKKLPRDMYNERQWPLLGALLELLPRSVAHLRLVFQRRNAMDFVEQSLAASRALGDGATATDLALKLDYRIRHILMDEFQDTSRSQYVLLEKLLAGWQADDGRTLFLVGDPMQSIYGFREADVGGFLRAREHGIADIRLTPLTLHANFRSTPRLVENFNRVFPAVMPSRDNLALGAVSYAPAQSAVADTTDSGVHVHAATRRHGREGQDEADEVVATIEARLRQAPYESIAVLARSRSHLHAIYARLLSAAVAFEAVDVLPLNKAAAIQDLLSVARTMSHDHDRMAWLAVLRAPWCGLTLASLHTLCAGRPHADLWHLMNDDAVVARLAPDERARLLRARGVYRDVFARAATLSFCARLEWLWRALGGAHCHAAAAGDVTQCLELLERLEQSEHEFDWADILARLGRAHSIAEHREGPAEERPSPAPVQLMTIHKCKGMQFDTVILPGLEKGARAGQKPLLAWHEELGEDDDARLLLAPIPAPGDDDAAFEFIRARQKRRQAYETQRLLYVGMTRAKKHAHLFTTLPVGEDGAAGKPRADTFLELLYSSFADAFAGRGGQGDNDASAAPAPPPAAAVTLKRVAADWSPRAAGPNVVWQGAAAEELEPEAVEFSWAGLAARLVGTVTHQYLRHMAQSGVDTWSQQRIAAQQPAIATDLLSLGLPRDKLQPAVARALTALTAVTRSPRGRWLLAAHDDARSEYAISGVVGGRVVNRIIDRTFVDEHGVRWIIDYKTSTHEGGNLEGFLDEEQRRYRAQLEEYAALLAAEAGAPTSPPIRLGLYFPLVDGWREWAYAPP